MLLLCKSMQNFIADVLIGNFIMGNQLKIRNAANTVTLDESGILIKVPRPEGGEETVFQADTTGNVMLKGKIYATSGAIGGLTIAENGIGVESEEGEFALVFDENGISSSNGLFSVNSDGKLTAKDADISGVITATSGTIGGLEIAEDGSLSTDYFEVDKDGKLKATGGAIGGFTIGSSALYNGVNSMTTSGTGVYLGTDGLNLGGNFTVQKDGTVLIKKGEMQIGTETENGTFTLNLTGQHISFNQDLPIYATQTLADLSPARLEYKSIKEEEKNHGGICMSHEGSIGITAPYTVVWGYPQLN